LEKREEAIMELRQYFNVIKRWWWLLIVGMIIPMSISYYFLSKQPALYQAKVTLVVGSAMQQPGYDPTLARAGASLAQAYTVLVKRRPITQAVIQRLNLKKAPEELAAQITAWISPEAQLLEIIVTDTSPQAAALIANALADELIRQSPGSVEESRRQQEFVQGQLADLQAKITNEEKEIRELEDSLANLTSAADIEEAQRRLSGLQGVAASYRSTYASLYQSLINSSATVLTVVEPAIEPTWPVSTRSRLILLVAGAAGLALSLGGAFVIEFLDDTLRWESYKDHSLLNLPVVGLMPRLPQEYGHISTDIPLDSSEAEALRLLRANIFLTLARRSISTILATSPGRREGMTAVVTSPISTMLVTSPGRREGRTTIVASLGMVIASGGQRVIIVDADLRTPDLHEVFGLPNDYGLCELLLGHAPSLPKALQETSIPNLNLLAAGRPPLDLALALTSPRLIELLEALMEQADVIIFDSPPVLLAPDTALLSGLVEGTLLTVRDGYTTLESASKAKERLSAYQGAPVMGVLFSRARLDRWTLLPRRRPRPKPLIAPPSTREEGLAPLVDLAYSALEAAGSGGNDDLRRESGLLLSQDLSSELEKEINRVWPEGQPMSAEDENLRDRIDMALDTLRLIEQRFGGEVAEEWYPPRDEGVEAEPVEGLAVNNQMTEGEDGAE
jgi:succinoglycan biosynthesis transport protein ExoP